MMDTETLIRCICEGHHPMIGNIAGTPIIMCPLAPPDKAFMFDSHTEVRRLWILGREYRATYGN